MTDKPVYRRSTVEGLLACSSYESTGSPIAAFGEAFHDAVARYQLACKAAGEETLINEIGSITAEAFWAVPRGLDPGCLEDLVDLVSRWAFSHDARLSTLFGVEYTIVADCGDFLLTGTVDRLDRLDDGEKSEPPTSIEITDWKSGWGGGAHTFQMCFYAGLALRAWPSLQTVTTTVDHPRKPAANVREQYSRDEIDPWFDDVLTAFRERLTQGAMEPRGGAQCIYCAHRLTCAAALPEIAAVPSSDNDAAELFRDYHRHKVAAAGYWEALQTYVGANRTLEIDDQEVGYLEPLDQRWVASDPAAIVGYLNKKGLDGGKVLYTSVDKALVPPKIKEELVTAGLARWERGPATFKARRKGVE
jgi:hypothetical protein